MWDRIRRRKIFRSLISNIKYIFSTNMARRRFSMLNTLFPKSPDGKNLRESVIESFNRGGKILDLGCGDRAQSLIDLYNGGFDNLYGIDINPPTHFSDELSIKKTSVVDTGYDNNMFKGTIYSSYMLAYLSPGDQLLALNEIDRISGPGSRGFLGPFQPKKLVNTEFSTNFSNYKNPLLGYVDTMNKSMHGKWQLSRNLQYNTTAEINSKKIGEYYYRISIPIFSAYVMYGRSMLRRFMPVFKVSKDKKVWFSFEYYISFTK